ncbi:MAG: FAD-binding and (Fe-S)-binding domain-containing protein [Nitrospira sp.]|nr:FAD-binding oxidoreductase [Candidatus Manganitrophaceae bacterium]HIL34767.1 FAD-binding oxidoreductase [Candidatus Manganitrophaceae bacterium]
MSFNLKQLTDLIGPEKVLSDPPAITAYAIDASIYKVTPKAIVLITCQADMESALRYARKNQVPLTARSGGTNLTGNAVGEGLILEFSRLNRILEINDREQWARVQPGITYAELNRRLSLQDLMFAPDPSSGEMCKLGGMLGNNAAGPHSLKYGATKDNVLEMEVLLSNGNWITAKEYRLDDPLFQKLLSDNPPLKALVDLIGSHHELILSKKRKVSKNSSGYNLFALAESLEQGRFPLHQLFIGSEGTLGLVREAKIKLVPRPPEVATALVYFRFLSDLGKAVKTILSLSPSALEMMDAATLDLIGRETHDIPHQAEAMLLIEFDESVREKMEALLASLEKTPVCATPTLAFDPEKQAALWKVRKAINPILYMHDAKKKPIHFVDDVVVPADRIPELIPYLEAQFSKRGVKVAIYGHIGDGNAHINPLLDLNDPDDFEKMTDLYHEIHQVVINRFEGSLCGEHGDGRVRAELLEGLYGPEIYALFKEVKRLFDPENLLNPGVKISDHAFTDQIDYERYTKPCATCGKCNAVCPVYDVVGEESNAARGWFHILTDPDYSYEKSARVVEACINCKSCRTVCPAGIDVSALILKKREEHPNKTAGALFAFQSRRALFESFLKVAAWTQPIWDTQPVRLLIEYLTLHWVRGLAPTARIPSDMVLPRLAKQHLRERYSELTKRSGSQSSTAYFHGCAANYIDDGVGDAVIDLLKKNGVDPALPPQRCSGTPIQTYGVINRVREDARFNMDSMESFERVITGCASCTFMLKDYATIFPEGEYHQKALGLAEKVFHISEFMADRPPEKSLLKGNDLPKKRRVTYHSSCHLRAAGVNDAPRRLLRQDPSLEFVEMPDADRCAGGAGTFCIKNPKQSAEIFERKRRGIAASGAEVVVTSCPACMIQLKNGLKGGVDVKHIAQVLNEE